MTTTPNFTLGFTREALKMNDLANYFLITFGEIGGVSAITFPVVWVSRRKVNELTFLRGTSVFLIGWGISSILVFIVHLLFSICGIDIRDEALKNGISLLVGILIMNTVYTWLSKKRT
jgi:hypothetical protein